MYCGVLLEGGGVPVIFHTPQYVAGYAVTVNELPASTHVVATPFEDGAG
jgi:hypothetical protein